MSNWLIYNKADDEELLIAKSEDEEDDTSARKTDGFRHDLPINKVWSDISTKVVKSVGEYKKRWKHIKNSYLLRNQSKETMESAELKTRMRWSMANRASFIRTVYNLNTMNGYHYSDIEDEREGSKVPFLKPK